MKRIVLFTCATLLVANFLFGLLLSSYEWLNVLLSSGIIILSSTFMLLIGILPLKDGFKSSLYVIYPALGFIEFMLSAFSPDRIKDNWAMIALILLVAFQIIFLFITNIISNKIK
ncbi:hypothetical protein B5F78_15055 [Bacteroides sp. An279]|nr:hypothetical protein B5F78_15055 [Bacteroides sp. An279]